jgi:hypothetical protein
MMNKYIVVLLVLSTILSMVGCVFQKTTVISPPLTPETPYVTPDIRTMPPSPSQITQTPEKSTTPNVEKNTKPAAEPCIRPVLTASPVDIDKIDSIVTLGNLNPPGHTFPTDHIYFYLSRQPGADHPDVADLFAPGDLPVMRINASQHVTAGFTDYNITFQPCQGIIIMYGHVTSLNPGVFGSTANFSGWSLENEYSTGGETYRFFTKEVNIPVKAGDLLGTAGGNPGQWALDFNYYDESYTSQPVANPERWRQSNYVHALCPLSLYQPGALLDKFISLINREKVEGESLPWGKAMQDIPGTAQGCWFLDGTVNTYPEDPHLALVRHNIYPSKAALSIGKSLPGFRSGVFTFSPLSSGFLNRDFKDITPDGHIYGFRVNDFNGIIIVMMPDKNTLNIEALVGTSDNPDNWKFTVNKVIFVR